jgi:hypothetical protein
MSHEYLPHDKHQVSALEIFNTITRSFWPVLKAKVTDALDHQDLPLGDTNYKLRIGDIDLQKASLEIVDFMSTGTKAQNDVLITKPAVTAKNPFAKWTSQDVGRWVTTLGVGSSWDSYESIIKNGKVSGTNLATKTLKDFESLGIPQHDAEIILRARDKILGFNPNIPLDHTEKGVDTTNEFDLDRMLQSVSIVAGEEQFQSPMESWSMATVQDWLTKVAHNTPWKKCLDIFSEQNIDGKKFQHINANVLIQYGLDESYALALIQARDEFLKHPNVHHHSPFDIFKHHKKEEEHPVSKPTATVREQRLDYEIGLFSFAVRLHGPLQLNLRLMSNEEFVPDCMVHVKDVDFAAKLQIQFDIVRNIIQICFLEKPKIKTDLDVKFKLGITLPLIGEDLWLPTLAERILETRNEKHPIVINIDPTE